MTKAPTAAWRAGADQIGHAFWASRRPAKDALCGMRLAPERLAWPPVAKCPDCLVHTGVTAVPME